MSSELKKRIITSVILLCLFATMLSYSFVLIISSILIAILCWVEFYVLISKIFLKKNTTHNLIRFSLKGISLLYLSFLTFLIITIYLEDSEMNTVLVYSIFVSIMSDIGGLIVGRTLKGRKLTKISPNKTISGSIGSFIFSLALIPFFINLFLNYDILQLTIFTIILSLVSQIGDLFISFLKRKAKVKNTSDLLPGHGGVLDRIDGIIFVIPTAIFLL